MKKSLLVLITLCCMATNVWSTDYPIFIMGVRITDSNKNNVLGDGKVSYDPATNTITLTNVNLTAGPTTGDGINSMYDSPIIKCVGTNTITAVGNYHAIYSGDNLTITGGGITLKAENSNALKVRSELKITGGCVVTCCNTNASAIYFSSSSYTSLCVDKSTLLVEGDGKNQTINNCMTLTLVETEIATPHTFDDINHTFVNNKGEVAKDVIAFGKKGCMLFYHATTEPSLSVDGFTPNFSKHVYNNGTGILFFPSPLSAIGEKAFSGSSLTSIVIPQDLTSIGSQAFENCTALQSVQIPDLNAWCKIDFADEKANPNYYAHHLLLNGAEITELVIPNEIKHIKPYTFECCDSLQELTIHNGVSSIGKWAFWGCCNLLYVDVPSTVTSIGEDALKGVYSLSYKGSASGSPWGVLRPNCLKDGYLFYENNTRNTILRCHPKATDVLIEKTVTSIEDSAFMACSSLQSIVSKPATPPTCGKDCFYGVDKSIPVYVYPECVTTYQAAAGWKDFTNIQKIVYCKVSAQATNGKVTGTGEFEKGIQVSLTAVPDTGYQFQQWSNGATDNPYMFLVTQDTVLEAFFETKQVTISVSATHGTVTGDGTYSYGTEVTLTATADDGYVFRRWSNGSTKNPYKFIATEDLNLTASFKKESDGIEEVQNAQCTMHDVRKVMRDGQLMIIREGEVFNAIGVKL